MKNKKTKDEIEIRFLVTELSPDFPFKSCFLTPMIQGYIELASSKKSFRARLINNEVTELTAKSGRGLVRQEPKYLSNDPALGRFFLDNLADHRIPKDRYSKDGWEIDFCKDNLGGIIVAECEFNSIEDVPVNPTLPTWIGKGINVTESLTSHHLARLNTLLEGTNTKAIEAVLKHLNPPVPKIVLDGGPCSGKSDIMKKLKKERSDLHCVSEVATIVMTEVGVKPGKSRASNIRFQKMIYKVQSVFENTSTEQAKEDGKIACILDRARPSGAAYFTGSLPEFERVINTSMREEYKDYLGVICLEVAPENIYEKMRKNNPARTETYEQACARQQKTIDVWKNHPNFNFIANGSGGWHEKERKVFEIIDLLLNNFRNKNLKF